MLLSCVRKLPLGIVIREFRAFIQWWNWVVRIDFVKSSDFFHNIHSSKENKFETFVLCILSFTCFYMSNSIAGMCNSNMTAVTL